MAGVPHGLILAYHPYLIKNQEDDLKRMFRVILFFCPVYLRAK